MLINRSVYLSWNIKNVLITILLALAICLFGYIIHLKYTKRISGVKLYDNGTEMVVNSRQTKEERQSIVNYQGRETQQSESDIKSSEKTEDYSEDNYMRDLRQFIKEEEMDIQWSEQSEKDILNAFSKDFKQGVSLIDFECKSSLCITTIIVEEYINKEELIHQITTKPPWNTHGHISLGNPEALTATIISGREGYKFPSRYYLQELYSN